MKKVSYEKGQFTEQKVFIGGLEVYLYNADAVEKYVASNKSKEYHINVAYILQPRGDHDHTFGESIAYNILQDYYSKSKLSTPLVCVAWDAPNHGSRCVQVERNTSWEEGNVTHALDMISMIDSYVEETKLIMDSLQAHLNVDHHLPPSDEKEAEDENRVKFFNIISGVSLGAHTSIRFASKYPKLAQVINPMVGCSDLSTLLLNRLQKIDDQDYKKKFYFNYEELGLDEEQRRDFYPKALHKHVSKQDINIFENLSNSGVKMFASFGADDKLVPAELSRLWVDMYSLNNTDSQSFTQEHIGHQITIEMIDKFTTWLIKQIPIE